MSGGKRLSSSFDDEENWKIPLLSLSFLLAILVFINILATPTFAPASCFVAAYTIGNFNWTNGSTYNGSTIRFFADFQYTVGTLGMSEPTNVYFLVNASNFSMTYYNSTLYSSNTINSTVFVYNYTDMQAGTWNYWFDGWKYSCSPAVHSSSPNYTLVIASGASNVSNITFVAPTPANGTTLTTTNNSIFVNVSSNSSITNHSVFLDWNYSLLGWWSFDSSNASGAYDNSTYSLKNFAFFNNTAMTNTTSIVTAKYGLGINLTKLSTTRRILVAQNSNFSLGNSTPNYTIEGWFNPAQALQDSDPSGYYGGLAQCSNSSWYNSGNLDVWLVWTSWSGGAWETGFRISNSSTRVTTSFVDSPLVAGQWYHIAVTRNTTQMVLYKNGAVKTTYNIPAGYQNNVRKQTDSVFCIGTSDTDVSGFQWNGSIDEVRVYNRSLSAAEINASFNASTLQYAQNFTGLGSGDYYMRAWSIDSNGLANSTENRLVSIGNAAPAFQWQAENFTNGSAYVAGTTTQFFVNYSDNNGTSSMIMTFNSSNYSMSLWNGSTTNGVWNYNLTLTAGTDYFNFSAYDGELASQSQTFELVVAAAATRSNGIAGYYGKNGSFTTFDPPVYRLWSGSTANWTGENAASNLSSTTDQWVVLHCDNNQTNCLMGTLITNGTVQAQAYKNGAWGTVQTIAPNIGSTNSQARGFDIAFEYARGWGLVISGNNTAYPYFDIWYPGNNTWSGVQQFPSSTCGGTPLWVEAASKPNSNEIIAAYENSTGVCAYVWDGSTWGNPRGVNIGSSNLTQKSFCVAYETNSGHGELFYDNSRSGNLDYANWTGSAWQVSNICNPACASSGSYVWFSCASMPNSNRILWASPLQPSGGMAGATGEQLSFAPFCSAWDYFTNAACRVNVNVHAPSRLHYATAQLDVREWSQGWGTISSFTTTVEGDLTDRQLVDVAYIGGSGWGQMVYSPDGNFPKERRCMGATGCSNGSTGWTTARDTTATICGLAGTGSNQTDLIRLVSDSATNDTMLLYSTQSSTEPICGQLYDGTTNTWGTLNTLEDTSRVLPNARPFDFTFYNTSTNAAPQFWWSSFNVTNGSIVNTTIPLTVQFFANWSDDVGVSSVVMTFNSSNYSMSLWNGSTTNGVWNFNLSNLTGVASGSLYSYNFTATDGSLANSSSNYNLNLTVDVTNISFVSPTPANGTTLTSNSIYVNVSSASNALYNHSVFLDWNYSLVGWWDMDFYNSTVVYDNSTYGKNATFRNGVNPNNLTVGKWGLGMNMTNHTTLASGGYLNVSTFGAVGNTTGSGFTVEGWFNPNQNLDSNFPVNKNYGGIVKLPTGGSAFDWGLYWQSWSKGWSLLFIDSAGTQYSCDTVANVFAGTWNHVAGVWNGSTGTFTMYVNGNVNKTCTSVAWFLKGPKYTATKEVMIGGGQDGYWNGSIDAVRIWNRSLTTAEIQASYNARVTQYSQNFTTLANASYQTRAWAVSSGGNFNSTELRQWTVAHPAPNVSFVSPTPANASSVSTNWINVSVSSTANSSTHSVYNDWNASLIGWWSFDFTNKTGVYDNSSYGNNATFLNGLNATNRTEGMRGLGLDFDGSNDYLNTSIYDNVKLSSAGLSLMFWMKTGCAGCATNRRIIAKGINSTDSFLLVLASNTDKTLSWLLASSGSNYNRTSSVQLGNNTWYHVAVVWNGTNSSMFINGTGVSGSTAGGLTQSTTFTPLIIGAASDGGAPFNGTLDEVQLYNRSLSQQEIEAAYDAKANQYFNNFTGLTVPATYTSRAWAIDREGYVNTTGLYSFNTNLAPQFWWASFNYTNGTNWNISNPLTVQFFVNVSDDGGVSPVVMTFNGTNYSMSLWNGTTANGVWNYNISGLAANMHLFNFTATDGLTANMSSNYNLKIIVSGMNVTFVSPTPGNGTVQAGNYTYVNVSSVSSDAEHSVFLDWNYSLVGWWNFDHYNSTVAFDNSTYGNNGTFAGGMGSSTLVSGARGYAQSFDGSTQYIDVGNRTSLNIGSAWTISLWLYSGSIGNTTSMRLVEDVQDGNNGYLLTLDNATSRLMVRELTAGVTNNYVSSLAFSNNTWYHVAVVWPGTGTPTVYINGTVNTAFLGTPPTLGTTSGFSIGRTPGSSNFFKGYIDEVMVFNRPLNQSEIGAIWRGNATNQSSRNYTSLPEGNYSFRAWAINTYGLINYTELRTVQINNVPPAISFVSPTSPEGTNLTTVNYFYINVSSNDTDSVRHSVYLDYNSTLLGWWPFDYFNNSVVYDNSTYNTSAYFQNGLGTQNLNASMRGKGLAFDGSNDYLNLTPSYSLVKSGGSFSIAFWVNMPSFGSFPRFLTKIDNDPAYGSLITFDSGNGVFTLDTMNNWVNTSHTYDCLVLTTNKWYYLAFTYNASSQGQNIYLDGSNQSCYSAGSGIGAAEDVANSFRIGAALSGANVINATLDEFQLYNRTLTPAEINASYNASQYPYAQNFSVSQQGNYTYRAWGIDDAGNVNETELRHIEVYSGCQDITSSNGLTLTRNASLIVGLGRTVCFDFTVAGKTGSYLDCSNFNVTDYTHSGTGIRSLGVNFKIQNCPLYNFTTHVYLNNANFLDINNVNATFGTTGFYFNGTANIGYTDTLVNVYVQNTTYGLILNGAINSSSFTKVNFTYVNYSIIQNYTSNINSYNNYTNVSIYNSTIGVNLTYSNNTRLADVYFYPSSSTLTKYVFSNSNNIYLLGGNALITNITTTSSNFTQAYYSQLNVTYCTNSSAVSGATAYFDSTSGRQFDSATTDSLGLSGWRNITSYYLDCIGICVPTTPTVNYTPHKFYGNLSGYINDTATVYLSQNSTGSACLNVGATIDATLVNYTVDFSTVNVGNDYYSHNATGLFNRSFTLNNTGTAKVNVTVTASNPFTRNTTSMPGTWYRYNVTESSSGTLSRCELQVPGNWYGVNQTGQSGVLNGICQLNMSTTGAGMAVIAINLKIPSDEPAGVKSSTVIFTSSQS